MAAASRMVRTIDLLDRFYAAALGCKPEDLNAGKPVVVTNERIREIRFAKGWPAAVYAVDKAGAPVVSVRPPLDEVIRKLHPTELHHLLSGNLQRVARLTAAIKIACCFQGIRLYCEPSNFLDRSFGDVREVSAQDERAACYRGEYGGEVFGQIVDGRVVSWAAIKPFSDIAWDLRVDTLPNYRGRGYAKSVVSAALKRIFSQGKLANWGTDRTNTASLRTAYSVGFRDYGLDFGCIEEAPESSLGGTLSAV